MTRGFLDEGKRRDDGEEDVVSVDAVCIRQTDKAIQVRIGKRELWVPQSQVHDDSEVYALGHDGVLVLRGWFARKEGIE